MGLERELEELRSELREKEQVLLSKLRERQASIESLRATVLQVAQGRHAELERRRLDAAEKVWDIVISLRAGLPLLSFISGIRLEDALKGTEKDPSARTGFKDIQSIFNFDLEKIEKLGRHQLYVSPRALRAFNTYMYPIFTSKMILMAMAEGLGTKVCNLPNAENFAVAKEILPQWSEGIDKFGFAIMPKLMSDLEKEILVGLMEMLEGAEHDKARASQMSLLMRSVDVLDPIRNLENTVPAEFLRN